MSLCDVGEVELTALDAERRDVDLAALDEASEIRSADPRGRRPGARADPIRRASSQGEQLRKHRWQNSRALRPWQPAALRGKITVPSGAFAGLDDLVAPEAYERARAWYAGEHEIVTMRGGHFMHREHPEHFNRELLRLVDGKSSPDAR